MLNDYQKQAIIWDWDGYDNSEEYQYWCDYASGYGKNVLIPMCAHGQAGAYMAEKGFNVVTFDITPEMITEGRKRYGAVRCLELVVGDLLNLNLPYKNFDFAFIAGHGYFFKLPANIRIAKKSHGSRERTLGLLN